MNWEKPTEITDPVAEDWWQIKNAQGIEVVIRVVVGRPAPIPENASASPSWYCPVIIEARLVCCEGAGPVDALMNAVGLIRSFAESINYAFTPGARPQLP